MGNESKEVNILDAIMDGPPGEEETAEKLGTVQDQQAMERMGKKQELRRNFQFLSIWGFAVLLGLSWEFSLIGIVLSLPNGGTAGSIWMSLITCIGMGFVTLSMAEMASIAPTAGGQFHWCSEFAPRKHQKIISYFVGIFCVLGWQSGMAATCYVAAGQINAMIVVAHPDHVIQPYQTTLLSWGILIIAMVFNTSLFRKLPTLEGIVMVLHVLGFFAFIIVLWICAPRGDVSVFTNFEAGGWSNAGVACLVALTPAVNNVIGADSSVHLSEELRNASWVLPRSMMATVITNYVMSFITIVTVCFCLGDYEAALGTKTGQPYVEIILRATGSPAATIVLTAVMLVLLLGCTINNVTTSSRQLWSFARDGALPFSPWLAQVKQGWDVPVNTLMVSLMITVVLTCIAIGSNTAYEIFLSLALSGLLTSYLICITCIFTKRLRGEKFPPSKYDLGRAGNVVNAIAICFLSVVWVFQFFPFSPNPDAAGMNWAVVIYGSFFLLSALYYVLRARHRYVGPVVYVKRFEREEK